MATQPLGTILFYSNRPSSVGLDFTLDQDERSHRGTTVSLLILAWLAVIDLVWTQTNVSTLYVIPLLLTATTGKLKLLRRMVGLIIVLTYAVYFLKHSIAVSSEFQGYLNFRLVNRTFVAIMIIVMGEVLRRWITWRREQADTGLPVSFRHQDQEISETLAVLCCVPMIILLGVIDFVSPSNYNLAILYPIPLFICGWTRSRRLPWAVLAVLLVLSGVACYVGPPSTVQNIESYTVRNRCLTALAMIAVTIILTTWMRSRPREAPADPDES